MLANLIIIFINWYKSTKEISDGEERMSDLVRSTIIVDKHHPE